MDTHARSWAKSVSWRLLGLVILIPMVYLVTGSLGQSALIGVSFTLVRFVLYYAHERAWEGVSWGRQVHPLSRIPLAPHTPPEAVEAVRAQLESEGYVQKIEQGAEG